MDNSSFAELFEEHRAPSHATKQDVHDQLSPVLRVGALVQKQMIEYRSRLTAAELSPDGAGLEGTAEHIHQTFAAVEREASAFVSAGRQLAKAMTQLDRYLTERAAQGNLPTDRG